MYSDCCRLLQREQKVESEGLVTESIHRYVEEISAVDESEVRLLQMGMPFDRDRGVELLKGDWQLEENCSSLYINFRRWSYASTCDS